MTSIFLSHSHVDKPFVRKLAADLRRHGVTVWVDEAEIRLGDSLLEKISAGLGQMEYVGAVLSHASIQSEWVRRELEIAVNREIDGRRMIVLPLLRNDVALPAFLSGRLYADFRDMRKYRRGLDLLLARLLPTQVSEPTAPKNEFAPEVLLITAGKFRMGSDPSVDPDAQSDEQPQHELFLPSYYLGKFPVTMAEYWAFVNATERDPPRGWRSATIPTTSPIERFRKGVPLASDVMHLPVNWVTWFDAVAYCRWLTSVTGEPYRLPSEAEWEKGARGTDGRIYPWGQKWEPDLCQADRFINTEPMYLGDRVVGGTRVHVDTYRLGQSPFGLRHMAGNVQDWTLGIFRVGKKAPFPYPYDRNDGRESLSKVAKGLMRVVRGGGFLHKPLGVRCAYRDGRDPSSPAAYGGFRVLKEAS